MSIQSGDLHLWAERLKQAHKSFLEDRLDWMYRNCESILVDSFDRYLRSGDINDYIKYASYYAIVVTDRDSFLTPVMGVKDLDDGKKSGYICLHPYAIFDAFCCVRYSIERSKTEKDLNSDLFDNTDKLINCIDNVLDEFLTDLVDNEQDDETGYYFYYGDWISRVDFYPDGDSFFLVLKDTCEYHMGSDVYHYESPMGVGVMVLPRKDVLDLLSKRGIFL